MKIEMRKGQQVYKEVYSGILLETKEGNQLGICMRDDTFEINVIPKDKVEYKWFRVDMQKVTIEHMKEGTFNNLGEDNPCTSG